MIQRWEKMTMEQLQNIRAYTKTFGEHTNGLIRIGLHFVTPYSEKKMNMEYVDYFKDQQKTILERLYKDVQRSKRKATVPYF